MNERTLDINTLCRDCVFKDLKAGVQVGCTFNRLDKFLDKEFIDNKYFRIKGFCNRCRDAKWAKDRKNLIEDVIKETELSIGYILVSDHDNQELHTSLKSILEQEIKPVRIAAVFFDGQQNLKDFIHDIKGIETPIDIVNILDNNLDSAYRRLEDSHYICLVKEGNFLPSRFSSNLNRLINEDLRKISMVDTNDNLQGYTIQTPLFNMLGGSFNEPLRDKIKKLAKIQNLEHMIIDYSEVIG